MHLYSGLDEPAQWVLPRVLAEQARVQPEASWFIGVGGEQMSFGSAHADVQRAAAHFRALGVKPGDPVVIMAGSHADFVRAWLGLLSMGAVAVLLNTELHGAFLEQQIVNSDATLAVIDAQLLPVLAAVAPHAPRLQRVMLIGQAPGDHPAAQSDSLTLLDWADWRLATPAEPLFPLARDIACIMYTSGTSGPSKGVLMPHAHCTLYGIGSLESVQVRGDDRWYIVLPIFHVNGLLMQLAATLLAGIPAVVRLRFSASQWLQDIREHGATLTNCLGALASFIAATAARDDDRQHRLRLVNTGPNLPALEAMFRDRFSIQDVISGYGMTEINIPIWGRAGHSTPGAAGWVYARHFELIVADPETDHEVPRGQIGEILVRPRTPWGFMAGYYKMPDNTVEAWRNLWFHTGDAATMDEHGVVTFVDRLKDCIRRRGENIAATEVEALVAALPGVAEVAAYAVPSDLPGGEDELMLAVVPNAGDLLDLLGLGEAADALLPRFARPRYLQVVAELPKTATGKVQRAVLRHAGIGQALDRSRHHDRITADSALRPGAATA
jgi:carnitine-CoA ligase